MTMINDRTKRVWMSALLACALLLAGFSAGCKSPASSGGGPSAGDKKAMIEAVAKWYVAQGELDINGFKAGIYDPDDLLGVATMTTAPEGAEKSEVKWSWVGETAVVTIPSQETTAILSASPTVPNGVLLKDETGQGSNTFIMKNDNGVWKIDVAETQKATQPPATPEAEPTTDGAAPKKP